ncbi:hypothetical protein [Bacillus benzoevorans]|uniref:Uncharacterized protein n=2 Tax=Bacillus benzoevorans TaxID=1456 RepID=A0A7X0HNK1_9BACI|nr:hypothetical protein [Bacillus benzoevorans]
MCFLFLVQYFAQFQWLQYLVVIMALFAFIGSILNANRMPGILGLVMMGVGIGVELLKGTGFSGISEGIFLILPLLCLITLAPLLSIPLKIGGFFKSVSHLLHNLLSQPKKMYAGITGTLFFLSPILNLASVRIINEFLEDLKLPSALTAKSYVVGFATASMWSPYFASVSLMIHYLHISYEEFILYGLGFSILSLVIGNLLFALWERRHPFAGSSAAIVPLDKADRYQLIKLILFVACLMGVCLLVEELTNWSMIVIVCLLAVIVPLLFAVKRGNWKRMPPLLKDFRDRNVPLMSNEIVLFMSAGMLAFSLKGTTVMNGVSDLLAGLANQSFFLFAFALILIVLCITYIGIHQIAVIGALAMQLSVVDLGVSNLAVALILLLSWAISMSLSPFSGLNLLVSRFSRLSGRSVGLGANGLHSFVVAFISIAIISLIA